LRVYEGVETRRHQSKLMIS